MKRMFCGPRIQSLSVVSGYVLAVAGAWIVSISPNAAWAAGKKPLPSQTIAGEPAVTTPDPFRPVVLRPVGTRPFNLPNGSRVDLTADLEVLFSTAVTQQSRFLPAEFQVNPDPCEPRLELRAAVSTLELNVAELGITIGYKPTGESVPISSLTGKANVKIGTIAMDVGVWQCARGNCVELAAATASHATAGVGLSLEIDFGVVNTGPSLIANTQLGPILRTILGQAVAQLSRNPRLSKLAWSATVREVSPAGDEVIFDAGSQVGLEAHQAFEVYAPASAEGSCEIYRTVAALRSTRADTRSTTAQVDALYGSRGIKVGDVVMIREVRK